MSENKTQDNGGPDERIALGSPLPHDPDAPHVGPTFAGRLVIGGGLKGVNDAGSDLVDVRITRYEAEVLLRHWFERKRDTKEFCFFYETSGSEDWRVLLYASYRLHVLAPHVSAALLDELREEARRRHATLDADREAYRRELPDELREEARLRHATLDAVREAYRRKAYRRSLEADSKANRPALDADEEGDEFADPGDRE